ncbi:class I SAM-dependent methyltransferase [Hymenobacter sp. 5317J-9]|uniref:class I SAM-dependent methyltransferase n=1 Tax=Hymenobacter sp. 5317J-9 TaxID=2932250 RepID=UPI001FD70C70|nr:class I SAM-dependent methyltransferase [Hymenobacter sp. 5317J-9]UOQ96086.1 class I SAM-dependent methyltransferase [Hymenobacter sp. 5317J-9]
MNKFLEMPCAPTIGIAPLTTGDPAYAPARVQALFDAMAPTYGFAPWLSGGMLGRWRQQLVDALHLPAENQPVQVVDLMAGGADLWPALRRCLGCSLHLTAVDFSAAMLARASRHAAGSRLALHPADALATGLPAGQAHLVTSTFGLKTLAPAAYPALAHEAARLLQPGGQLALLEVVLPTRGWLRRLLHAYLALLIPLVQRLCPAAAVHAALAGYLRRGSDPGQLRHALRQAGFGKLRQQRLWPGCAVLLTAELTSAR